MRSVLDFFATAQSFCGRSLQSVQLNGFRESLENLGRSRSSEKHGRLVFAKEAREGQNAEGKAERLMTATGHHLEDEIALLRQRNTSTLYWPWRPAKDRSLR